MKKHPVSTWDVSLALRNGWGSQSSLSQHRGTCCVRRAAVSLSLESGATVLSQLSSDGCCGRVDRVFTALASTKSCSDSFFQVNEDVFKTSEASASDLKVTLVSSVSLWLCSVGEETECV